MTITYPFGTSSAANVDLTLGPGSLVDVQPPKQGVQIQVRDGSVWITQAGDPTDHVLGAGESFQATGRGLVVVQALENARLGLP